MPNPALSFRALKFRYAGPGAGADTSAQSTIEITALDLVHGEHLLRTVSAAPPATPTADATWGWSSKPSTSSRASAVENVMAALMFSDIPTREHRPRALELLARLGITAPDRDADRLSVSQRQRVAVARALACRPVVRSLRA